MQEEVMRLAQGFADAAADLGWMTVVTLINPDEHDIRVGMNTRNVSEATTCVGQLLRTILEEGEPSCPHCLNNYRRCEAALRTMHEHGVAPKEHLH